PFCGSANLESGGDDKIVAVRCRDCEATGPNHYGSRAEWNTRSLHLPEPQTAPDEICILCANGNDLPEGETCPGCKRAGHAVGLAAAVIKARGRNKPPSTPVKFGAAPADAERLALAERIEKHVNVMANTSMHLSLEQWGDIANDLLTASAALRAGGWREDMENGRHGFIVSSADEKRFRFWDAMGPTWTTDRVRALRFARRIDAERFAAEDEDAWKILEVVPSAPHTDKEG
ncbi:MAG: hypothetical protein JSS57_07195, partial [Proteobacteria bacterium]|nr:hypothetical protein [Pseudomonadota bacterium]